MIVCALAGCMSPVVDVGGAYCRRHTEMREASGHIYDPSDGREVVVPRGRDAVIGAILAERRRCIAWARCLDPGPQREKLLRCLDSDAEAPR